MNLEMTARSGPVPLWKSEALMSLGIYILTHTTATPKFRLYYKLPATVDLKTGASLKRPRSICRKLDFPRQAIYIAAW